MTHPFNLNPLVVAEERAAIAPNEIEEIRQLHGEINALARTSLEKAIRVGELLTNIKSRLSHGEWLPWIKENLPFTERTARNYIRLHENRELLKSETISDLTDAYKLLTAKPTPQSAPESEEHAPVVEVPVKPVAVMFRCDECDHEVEEAELEEQPLYECDSCSSNFTRDNSADGCSHRCPECNKFGRKISDYACPECNEGELTRQEIAPEPTPAPDAPGSNEDWKSFKRIAAAVHHQIKELAKLKVNKQHTIPRRETITALIEELEACRK